VIAIRYELAKVGPDEKLAVIRRECAKLKPPEFGEIVESLLLTGREAGMAETDPIIARYTLIERLSTLFCGAVIIGILLYIAFITPNPTQFQYTFFRIVLAIAAGAATATLPGTLNVEVNKYVRAGGAFGMVLLVYFWNPIQLVMK
jgi:uncharacterized BrkB/YihY/UPF0761 family membrane protein